MKTRLSTSNKLGK